jgi:hypothetical protein
MRPARTLTIAVIASMAVAGCSSVRLALRAAPMFPDVEAVPSPPPLPEAAATRSATNPEVERQLTAAHPPADLRPDVVALVLDGPVEARATILELLAPLLIGRGYTRVLYPFAVQEVTGTLDRTEEGSRIRTTVAGRLDQLALLGASSPASYLLALQVREFAATSEEHTTHRIPPEALAHYRDAGTAYRQQIAQLLARLRGSATSYAIEAREAMEAYEAAGGTYEDPDEQAARDRANAFLSQLATAEAQLVSAGSRLPAPEALEQRAAAANTMRGAPMIRILLRATLTDLRAGETFWMLDVQAMAPERKDALSRALQALVEGLGGGA